MKWKNRKSIPLGRSRQMYILAVSLDYKNQPERVQAIIRRLCEECCPGNGKIMLRYVTSEQTCTRATMDAFYASETTIHRATKKYFLALNQELSGEQ